MGGGCGQCIGASWEGVGSACVPLVCLSDGCAVCVVWQWKFREGVDKVLKEVDKCSTALTAVERKRRHLSFIQAVTPLAPHLDSGSQRGRGGDVASLQADLLGVWDLWNRLRTAVLARAEGPGLSMLLVYDMRCGAHKVDSSHLECPQRLDLAKAALEALAQRHPQVYTLQPTLPPNCPYYPLYDPAFHTYRTEVSANPRLAQRPSSRASHPPHPQPAAD